MGERKREGERERERQRERGIDRERERERDTIEVHCKMEVSSKLQQVSHTTNCWLLLLMHKHQT